MNSGTNRPVRSRDYQSVRASLLNREEIAFLDVREEALHATGHPLFAANFPFGRIELDAYTKLPRSDVPIVTFDDGEGLATKAAERFHAMGFSNVAVFDGGLLAWKAAGGEVFIDVNVPSKAFGELLVDVCGTPWLTATEIGALIDTGSKLVVVDVRRFDEYQTMSIPTGISVPGAELVLRVPDLAPHPETQIIVNCAGRTRSQVGAQSLINAGLPNPVAALRNGTMGWELASRKLDSGQSRTYSNTSKETTSLAAQRARNVADQTGVQRATRTDLHTWAQQQDRTSYFFDVRSLAEFEKAHLPVFYPMPGGQLVQETEMVAPVRGARIVLVDDDGTRANMTASWLAQMAWDVWVVDNLTTEDFSTFGHWQPRIPMVPESAEVTSATLHDWMAEGNVTVIDLSKHAKYQNGHIPAAWYLLRSNLDEAFAKLPDASRYVVTSDDGLLASFAAPELAQYTDRPIYVLSDGTRGWVREGYKLESGDKHLASKPIDRYRRPYEGTDAPRKAKQAYLDWEDGLIAQLERDGTHHFKVWQKNQKEKS